jgi:hypothetical protein
VSGADEVVLILSAGTDYAPVYPTYRGADPHAAVTERVEAAASKPIARCATHTWPTIGNCSAVSRWTSASGCPTSRPTTC